MPAEKYRYEICLEECYTKDISEGDYYPMTAMFIESMTYAWLFMNILNMNIWIINP